jgi:hypothetical protein
MIGMLFSKLSYLISILSSCFNNESPSYYLVITSKPNRIFIILDARSDNSFLPDGAREFLFLIPEMTAPGFICDLILLILLRAALP